MGTVKKRSNCLLSSSLDIFGDKWSLLIIRDLMFNNKNTYNDFLKSAEGIATNILASRLKGLEENGLIEKSEHPGSRAKILYRLTPKGIELLPVIIEIHLWAEKYFTIPSGIEPTLKEAKKDREALIKSITKSLMENISL
ncbi:MAG: helix-turn-helix domain-containing protein [Dyadobacter sp.]|uniref:winged helix-turn-helix transcriptional regulator n=1 Tax=Dyadobacter sp. TaxID=1914288 RepID=UPI003266534A